MNTKKIYYHHIDSLRALAVFSVFLYHINYNNFFVYGFLGVDIFFVISGFLIFKQISDLKKSKIEIFNYFSKRYKRIIPALVFAIIFVQIYNFIFSFPKVVYENAIFSLSSFFPSANITSYIRGENYFTINYDHKLLKHIWSLSVEEQFYIIAPFIFIIFFRNKILLFFLICFLLH